MDNQIVAAAAFMATLLGNWTELIYATGTGFLFSVKTRKQLHSRLCNRLRNTGDGAKDKPVVKIAKFTLPSVNRRTNRACIDGKFGNLSC